MVGCVEIDYSLALIARAKKRLDYQRSVAARLPVCDRSDHAAIVRDMCATMQAKLAVLERRHDELLRGSRPPAMAPSP